MFLQLQNLIYTLKLLKVYLSVGFCSIAFTLGSTVFSLNIILVRLLCQSATPYLYLWMLPEVSLTFCHEFFCLYCSSLREHVAYLFFSNNKHIRTRGSLLLKI